jgi:hypothetical protein
MRAIDGIVLLGLFIAMGAAPAGTASGQEREALRPPERIASGADRAARSQQLFLEAAKVITHPRCMNCHPAGEHPLQGDDSHEHQPVAFGGEAGDGIPGLVCGTCHSDRNVTLMSREARYRSIPGHPRWMLAPKEMAWQGKSLQDICQQLKDPARNGGRSLTLLHEHLAKDDLVAWAWKPGAGRNPAPGSQEELGALVQAWIDTGAVCP